MEIQALISMFAAAVLMTAIALLAIFIAGPQPPRLRLTDPTWQWTAWTTRAGEAPLAVPDPTAYTIQFRRDGTFEAAADCNQVDRDVRREPGREGGGRDGRPVDRAGSGQPRLLRRRIAVRPVPAAARVGAAST